MASSKDNVTCHLCPEGVFGEPRLTAPYAAVASTDFTYTGQRDLPGTGLMDYKARFYSPVLKRFIQPDNITPGMKSQSGNRYSYVLNNPINANDPSGHKCSDVEGGACTNNNGTQINGSGNSKWYYTPPEPKKPGGITPKPKKKGNNDPGNNHDDGGNNPDFFSDVAYTADNVGAIASDIELIVVDTIGVLVIAEGCITGVGCIPALIYAAAIDLGVSWFSPLGVIENVSGAVGLGATALSDIVISGTTYISMDENGYGIGIGHDTVVSAVNMVAGFVPEANFDAWISSKQLEYDKLRRSGQLPATSHEFHIPRPPDLWGKECNFFCGDN